MPCHIGAKDSGQLTLEILCVQWHHPLKEKASKRAYEPPWRLVYQNLLVVFCHVSLQKVRVMLSVDSETGLENSMSG